MCIRSRNAVDKNLQQSMLTTKPMRQWSGNASQASHRNGFFSLDKKCSILHRARKYSSLYFLVARPVPRLRKERKLDPIFFFLKYSVKKIVSINNAYCLWVGTIDKQSQNLNKKHEISIHVKCLHFISEIVSFKLGFIDSRVTQHISI